METVPVFAREVFSKSMLTSCLFWHIYRHHLVGSNLIGRYYTYMNSFGLVAPTVSPQALSCSYVGRYGLRARMLVVNSARKP